MKLILLRHAIAEELVHHDFDRSLTLAGRTRCRRVLRHFARRFPAPELIFFSRLRRARETAEIAASILKIPMLESEALQPGGKAFEWLCSLSCQDLMVVGHEPDLSQLAADFLGLPRPCLRLKKSGLALLQGEAGRGQLGWLLSPAWLI